MSQISTGLPVTDFLNSVREHQEEQRRGPARDSIGAATNIVTASNTAALEEQIMLLNDSIMSLSAPGINECAGPAPPHGSTKEDLEKYAQKIVDCIKGHFGISGFKLSYTQFVVEWRAWLQANPFWVLTAGTNVAAEFNGFVRRYNGWLNEFKEKFAWSTTKAQPLNIKAGELPDLPSGKDVLTTVNLVTVGAIVLGGAYLVSVLK